MIVRCGRCRSQFEVPGAGRHVCPACGTANDVRAEPAMVPRSAPAPDPGPPSPRVVCSACGFSFIVGAVAVAPCPNCGNAVTVPGVESEDS